MIRRSITIVVLALSLLLAQPVWAQYSIVGGDTAGETSLYGDVQDQVPNTFDAGYRFASTQGVTDASRCGGPPQFIAGCVAFAKELQEKMRLDQWGGGTYDAGYRWAVRRDIREPQKCVGPTQQFINGCVAFAQGMYDKMMLERKQQQDNHYAEQRRQQERFAEEQRLQQKRYEEQRYLEQQRLEQQRIEQQRFLEQQRIQQSR